jgi:hypothetical protein
MCTVNYYYKTVNWIRTGETDSDILFWNVIDYKSKYVQGLAYCHMYLLFGTSFTIALCMHMPPYTYEPVGRILWNTMDGDHSVHASF